MKDLAALHTALTQPLGPHLSDETLAEVATAEAAGENMERMFAEQLRHIEHCVLCAEAYSHLMEMSLAVFQNMTEAAEVVDPLAVYADLLFNRVKHRVGDLLGLRVLAGSVAASLPALFTAVPASPQEEHASAIHSLVTRKASGSESAQAAPHLVQSIHELWSALSIALEGRAHSMWGRLVKTRSGLTAGWNTLQLSLLPAQVAQLGGEETGDRWFLVDERLGDPIPVRFSMQADRLSPLACRISIHIHRPGLRRLAGRPVQLLFAGTTLEGQIDARGQVQFEPVPVGAISDLEVRFQV